MFRDLPEVLFVQPSQSQFVKFGAVAEILEPLNFGEKGLIIFAVNSSMTETDTPLESRGVLQEGKSAR